MLARFSRRLVTTTLAVTVAVFALGRPEISAAADEISVRLSFTPNAMFIPVYVAQAKGFYEQAGLTVKIVPGRGSTFAVTTIGSGQESFGIADAASIVTGRAKGLPVVAVANLQQQNGMALVARKAAGLTGPADLKGRKVGLFTGSTTAIFFEALLNKEGMALPDVSAVSVRPGTDLPLFLNGQVDAEVNFYNNDLIDWAQEHPELDVVTWRLDDLGFDTPGIALITNEATLAKNPAQVRAFTSATMKGLRYAIDHPQEAVSILTSAVPELKPAAETAKWAANVKGAEGAATKAGGLGALDVPKWEALTRLLRTYKAIDTDVDIKAGLQDKFRTAP